MKKIGILGSGGVARTLGSGFLKHGYEVMLGTREPAKLGDWQGENAAGRVGSFADAARFGEILVLAVKGSAARAVLEQAGPATLAGKAIIDPTNPIADAPPEDGVLRFFTNLDESLMEQLQKAVPAARFVKAFSCVGGPFMVDPKFPAGKPSMFICGDDDGAKAEVREILGRFGWEIEDMGGVKSARAIEPLCMLWCIPGMRGGAWNHAFKLIRA